MLSGAKKRKKSEFTTLHRNILVGLGMGKAEDFETQGPEEAFKITITRESTDSMFLTKEPWLCVFVHPNRVLDEKQMQSMIRAAIAANVRHVLAVVFGSVTLDAEEELFETLADERIQVVLLTDTLAEALICDYQQKYKPRTITIPCEFSFARLRKEAQAIVKEAPWKDHFQTTSIQPVRVLPLHREDAALTESDLARAMQDGSSLLLGEPGAGKTTSLMMLTEDLATSGGRTPVFLPLGRYQGDFWQILCEALAPEAEPVSKETAEKLLSSGTLTLLLDGMNEVQNPDWQAHLVAEINRLTEPGESTSRSTWIVSGRVHDYEQSRYHLSHLEARRWEMQPLTADLIFRFLADALGEDEGRRLYEDLGQAVREICANPLLLMMTLLVYEEKGRAPVSRGALYRQFIEILLHWGTERGLGEDRRKALEALNPEPLNDQNYQDLVFTALSKLADGMSTTMISYGDASRKLAEFLTYMSQPVKAARLLLEDLITRGMLKRGGYNRISFLHHTFQEYFQAWNMLGRPLDELIPQNGVPADRREAVIFLAGLMPDPAPLLKRVLDTDLLLAFEIWRDTPQIVSHTVYIQIAKKLWELSRSGLFIGEHRRWAILFQRLAVLSGKTAESLAAELDDHLSQEAQADNLMSFYAQLDDAASQRRVLEQAVEGEDVPVSLLFSAAWSAYNSGENKKAVELWTHYLEQDPDNAAAFNNRAVAYKELGLKEQALKDYQRAVELMGAAYQRCNLATLLHDMGRKEEALTQLRVALERDPTFAQAHSFMSNWLEADDPETALTHREMAVRYAPHDEKLRLDCRKLADLQEKLGRYAEAIRTLRRMIALDPTSYEVKSWKQRIARLRKQLDAEERARSARERLQEKGELPLPTLVFEWLNAAGLKVNQTTSTWLLAEGGAGLPSLLPVVLMHEPVVTASGLRDALDSVPRQVRKVKQIVMVTEVETLSLEARHQLAALEEEYSILLVTTLEVRDALLQSDRECRMLLDRALQRADQQADPFELKGIVREQSEFFGRVREFEELTALIGRKQQIGLYGIHKIGKSSLLEQLRKKLHISHPEITVLQIELNASLKDAGDFYCEILEKLPSAGDKIPTQHISAAAFRQALTGFHQRCQDKHPNHHLLFMLDEYAFLIPDRNGKGGLNGFIEVLGLLKAIHQEGWFSILPCGRTAALNRQASWGDAENPFIDLLHAHFLGPLSRAENDTLMQTLGLRAGLTFTPEALDLVYGETGGHPSFSRALGSQILRQGKEQVTPERVRTAISSFLQDHDQSSILRAIYERRLDQDEQEIARKLAAKGPQIRKQLFPAKANTEQRRKIRDAINNLIDTSVLIEEDGKIAHRYGLLRRIIRQETEELGYA